MPTKDRELARQQWKNWYDRNKSNEVYKNKQRRKDIRSWIEYTKKNTKCANCGFSHPAALDFHHIGLDKVCNIGEMVRLGFGKMPTTIPRCAVSGGTFIEDRDRKGLEHAWSKDRNATKGMWINWLDRHLVTVETAGSNPVILASQTQRDLNAQTAIDHLTKARNDYDRCTDAGTTAHLIRDVRSRCCSRRL